MTIDISVKASMGPQEQTLLHHQLKLMSLTIRNASSYNTTLHPVDTHSNYNFADDVENVSLDLTHFERENFSSVTTPISVN